MPAKTLLTAMAALCLLASCKKNSDSNAKNAARPKMYIEDVHVGPLNETDSFTLSYDANGRMLTMVGRTIKFVLAYSGNNAFTFDLYENGAWSIHERGTANSRGFLDSTFQYNNTNDSTTEKYLYNGALLRTYLVYNYTYQGASIYSRDTYTYDNDGNMFRDVEADGYGTINKITTNTYTGKPWQYLTGNFFIPPTSKYLPATRTVTDGAGNLQASAKFTYTFDGAGRLTKELAEVTGMATGYVAKIYVY